jgi:hypothetical protein
MANAHIKHCRAKGKSAHPKIDWDKAWASVKETVREDPKTILERFRKDGWLCVEDFCKMVNKGKTQGRIMLKKMTQEGKLEIRRELISQGTKTILCRPKTF